MRILMIVAFLVATTGCTVRQDLGTVDANTEQHDAAPAGQEDADSPGQLDANLQDRWEPDGVLLEQPRECPAPVDAGPAGTVIAVWEGYRQQPYPSGSDAVKIVLRETTGTLAGSITFGSGTPPPVPTMSNECYPQQYDPLFEIRWDYVMEGFEYPIVDGISTATRLKVDWLQWAPWRDWCRCRTSYKDTANPNGQWWCVPNWGGQFGGWDHLCRMWDETGTPVLVLCCLYELCGMGSGAGVCSCDATGCTGSTAQSSLDCALIGTEADCDGTHLTRTQ